MKMKDDVYRDVKNQKACEQGREANIGPKIKQTTSIYPIYSAFMIYATTQPDVHH